MMAVYTVGRYSQGHLAFRPLPLGRRFAFVGGRPATRPNRFEFIFTSKQGSWLNLIEAFSGKLAKTMLRGFRVASKAELKARLEQHLDELNAEPVVFHWKYGLKSLVVA